MTEDEALQAERAAAGILAPLRSDERVIPEDLTQRTMKRVHTAISTKELVELTTTVFVLRVCAPMLDVVLQLIRPTEGKQ